MGIMNRFAVLEDNDNCLYQLTELHTNIIKNKAEAKAKKARDEKRNWHDMPQDVLSMIFMKLGAIGILYRAQSVCSARRKLSKDPHLFRSINLCENQWDFLFLSLRRNLLPYSERQCCIQVRKIAQEVVHRSCGQLTELVIDGFCTVAIVHYILDRSHSIKCLGVFRSYRFNFKEFFIQLIRKVPFLEELEFNGGYLTKEILEEVSGLCSQFKCLRYSCDFSYNWLDEIAGAIADKMPQLGSLHLSGRKLTDIGLQALLDGCRDLEYLDLGQCVDANISEELRKECQARIKCLVLPVFRDDNHHDRIDDSDDNSSYYGWGYGSYRLGYESSDSEDSCNVDDDDTVFLPKKLVSFYRFF